MKKKEEKKVLSEEEKQVLMMSDDFHKFFDHASRVVERALAEEANVFVDYTGMALLKTNWMLVFNSIY